MKITLHEAENLGLIPKREFKENTFIGELTGSTHLVDKFNKETTRKHIEDYCTDKELLLCEFPRDIILKAKENI